MRPNECPLCQAKGEDTVWKNAVLRVILVDDERFPGYTRVIVGRHAKEMSDLTAGERSLVWATLEVVEEAMRKTIAPDKVNLASLGNMVPHTHWHVIPRWTDDVAFPDSPWSPAVRSLPAASADRAARIPEYRAALTVALRSLFSAR